MQHQGDSSFLLENLFQNTTFATNHKFFLSRSWMTYKDYSALLKASLFWMYQVKVRKSLPHHQVQYWLTACGLEPNNLKLILTHLNAFYNLPISMMGFLWEMKLFAKHWYIHHPYLKKIQNFRRSNSALILLVQGKCFKWMDKDLLVIEINFQIKAMPLDFMAPWRSTCSFLERIQRWTSVLVQTWIFSSFTKLQVQNHDQILSNDFA